MIPWTGVAHADLGPPTRPERAVVAADLPAPEAPPPELAPWAPVVVALLAAGVLLAWRLTRGRPMAGAKVVRDSVAVRPARPHDDVPDDEGR